MFLFEKHFQEGEISIKILPTTCFQMQVISCFIFIIYIVYSILFSFIYFNIDISRKKSWHERVNTSNAEAILTFKLKVAKIFEKHLNAVMLLLIRQNDAKKPKND